MIMEEKTTANGNRMVIGCDIDDGQVFFFVVCQRIVTNFGRNQQEAWAWFNATA